MTHTLNTVRVNFYYSTVEIEVMLEGMLSIGPIQYVGGSYAQVVNIRMMTNPFQDDESSFSNDTSFNMTNKKLFMFDSFQNLVFFFTFNRFHFFRKLQSLTNRRSYTLLMILNESLNMSHHYYHFITRFTTGLGRVTILAPCHQLIINVSHNNLCVTNFVSPM